MHHPVVLYRMYNILVRHLLYIQHTNGIEYIGHGNTMLIFSCALLTTLKMLNEHYFSCEVSTRNETENNNELSVLYNQVDNGLHKSPNIRTLYAACSLPKIRM